MMSTVLTVLFGIAVINGVPNLYMAGHVFLTRAACEIARPVETARLEAEGAELVHLACAEVGIVVER